MSQEQSDLTPNQLLFARLNEARIEQESGGGKKPRSAGRRWAIAGIVTVVIGGVLFGGLILANNLTRGVAEDAIRSVAASGGTGFKGDIDVTIAGDWPLFQFLSGSLESVHVTSDNAVVGGTPMKLDITASDVPVDRSKPAGAVTMLTTLDQHTFDEMDKSPTPTGKLSLGDGVFHYGDSIAGPFGIVFSADISATPSVQGTSLLLTPASATVSASSVGIDVTPVVDALLGREPVNICLADRMPEGAELQAIAVTPEAATLTVHMRDVVLNTDLLRNRGTC
ncbi:LmeA family phospholipid-binding protein [Mycetocola spongiae]|uniref:LmeA family phospholipid-binding protein n=1 Tax=Mycetocola spongiae TaxID=2859226 RepID=UPI001CF140E4|nr:DUF2993 domain-containing protein [Mycetocola spongiae]UCR90163.1 DUF2993 domain-containing protein [Mycetocola spongiae]